MKSKVLIITLIAVFGVLAILLTLLLVNLLTGNFDFNAFKTNYKISNNLVIDEEYDNIFNGVVINSNSSDISIKDSNDGKVRVLVYGDKDKSTVDVSNTTLNISSEGKKCVGFCFNTTIGKIEVYIPSDFDKKIDIDNDYGDISVDDFPKAQVSVKEDCGDINIKEIYLGNIENNYGDIKVLKAYKLNIKESAGDITAGRVDDLEATNDYGDIEVDRVNNYMSLKNSAGDIEIGSINLTRNSNIKSNYGDIEIGSTNEIYIDAKTDLGEVKVRNNYRKSDIKLVIKNDCGDIEVNN